MDATMAPTSATGLGTDAADAEACKPSGTPDWAMKASCFAPLSFAAPRPAR